MGEPMARPGFPTGVGGVFLRSADPDKLYAWYEEHLGMELWQPPGIAES